MRVLERARHLHIGSSYLLDGLRPDLAELFGRAKVQGLRYVARYQLGPERALGRGVGGGLAGV